MSLEIKLNPIIIDLNQAEKAVSSLPSVDPRTNVQLKRLIKYNSDRYNYLPTFPCIYTNHHDRLLLVHVPFHRLTSNEQNQRKYAAETMDAITMTHNFDYSNNFSLLETDAQELTQRFRIPLSIITFNAERIRSISYYFMALYGQFRKNILEKKKVALKEPVLTSKQMMIVLEYFLQMDVDLFCMKICSYRTGQFDVEHEGLFCQENQYEPHFSWVPCGGLWCSCCHPLNRSYKSDPWPVIDIVSSSKHQFLNGYTTYLNCPVTCSTTNIIYVMTCPCGQYDFVGSTNGTLSNVMAYHRQHGNRIIFQKLTGSRLVQGDAFGPIEIEQDRANKMKLYLHSARCPVALRAFLDVNPIYWCFIPQLWKHGLLENIQHFHESDEHIADDHDDDLLITLNAYSMDNQRFDRHLNRIPLPPAAYVFSYPQRQKQRSFFEQLFSLSNTRLAAYRELDLYQIKIINVLPTEHCSILLRYIIETFFIVHGETKLNMICPLKTNPDELNERVFNLIWCDGLKQPTSLTSTRITTA